jgi:hypothetical protein
LVNKALIARAASFSRCGAYRYHLWRQWDTALPRMLLIMLNPSTADHLRDDHTITKSIAIARHLGCGKLDVGNLAAFRSPHPADLRAAPDPIGRQNDRHLSRMLGESDLVVCAWGANAASLPGRPEAVGKLIRKAGHAPWALKLTNGGYPSHPLARGKGFVPVQVELVPFPV